MHINIIKNNRRICIKYEKCLSTDMIKQNSSMSSDKENLARNI